jgi:L-alanine-DL-glutamate epimerase-like enolase superfamily enzyme
MELHLRCIDLPLRHRFTIAHGSADVQRNVFVELRQDGLSGFGEAAPLPYYGVSCERIAAALEGVRPWVESAELGEPEGFWREAVKRLRGENFALCALDEAAHDLWGKRLGRPVYALWGLNPAACPPMNYTIGIDTTERMVAKMREFPGFDLYKIKLSANAPVDVIRELRKHTDARFRVDANTSWTATQTIAWSRELATLGVEFIEQPLPATAWEQMPRVRAESALPILADESCVVEEDVVRCAECFDGINIKLTKAGGLTPARRMIAEARRLGLKVMVGCMTESTVGVSAIAQLAPMLDYVDMDGPLLLREDVAEGVRIDRGRAIYPPVPGCGITWHGRAAGTR